MATRTYEALSKSTESGKINKHVPLSYVTTALFICVQDTESRSVTVLVDMDPKYRMTSVIGEFFLVILSRFFSWNNFK